jgi:hypothetical protein
LLWGLLRGLLPPGARYTLGHPRVLDTVDRALVNYISQSGDTRELTDALLSHLACEEHPLARYGFYGYGQD